MPKCFNGLCRFQNLVTTIDYKCGYYLNKSNLTAITVIFMDQKATLWASRHGADYPCCFPLRGSNVKFSDATQDLNREAQMRCYFLKILYR